MNKRTIDLNCDLGERDDPAGMATDLELLGIVSSANIACGGHAGDEHSMMRTVMAALARGVALGAHPGYPDRANFGRAMQTVAAQELEDSIATQVDAFAQVVDRCGGRLVHVKPHGALYHAAMRQNAIAEVVARGIKRVGVDVILVGQAGTPGLEFWRDMGVRTAAEAFADRRYEPDGALRARDAVNAVIDDPIEAAAQAVRIVSGSGISTLTGEIVAVHADTICLHSDTPGAIEIAKAVRDALTRERIRIQALS